MARERVFLRCRGHHTLCAWALVAVGQPQSQCKYPGAPSPPHLQVIELLPRSSSIRIQHPATGADAASPEPEVFHRENDHLRNETCKPQPTLPSGGLFPLPSEHRCPFLPPPPERSEGTPRGDSSHFPFPGPGWDIHSFP